MNNYTTMLREHNLKATPQRLEITDALYKGGHITIENLYTLMLKKFNSISLATIYKNINLMLETSFIEEVKLPNAKSVYELTKESHSHTICNKCGYVEDITLDLRDLESNAMELSKFQINHADLVFSGLCQKCK